MSSKIYIVGMGPGTGEMMTPQADHALCGSCSALWCEACAGIYAVSQG